MSAPSSSNSASASHPKSIPARVAWAAALLTIGCGLAPATSGQRTDAIRGGVVDDGGFPEVVSLAIIYTDDAGTEFPSSCTATVIGARTVLTAAHCFTPEFRAGTAVTMVRLTTRSPFPRSFVDAGWIDAEAWEQFPDWRPFPSPWLNDLALVRLKAPLPGIVPATYLTRDLQLHDTDRLMDVVGYGRTSTADPVGAGVRRTVVLPLRGLTPTNIELGDKVSAGVCNGDSGGPSYLSDRDGVRRVVGVHSWSFNRTDCADGLDSRVDLFLPFIRDFLMRSGGATCAEDGLCASGCATPDQDCACAANGRCDEACRNPLNDPDCPLTCNADGFCSTLDCATPDPDCAAELSTCTKDAQCAFRTCATDAMRNERYCSRPCHQSCVEGTVCAGDVCLLPYVPAISGPAIDASRFPAAGCSVAPGPLMLGLLLLLCRRARIPKR